ncbi:hypothetical protein ACIGO6_24295 [Streptomyces sp. NPDC053750]
MSEHETQVHGHCDTRFAAVRTAFEASYWPEFAAAGKEQARTPGCRWAV